MDNSRILMISDMHAPYNHVDTIAFLRAVKKKYRPTRVICVGDEIDQSALSFHDSDPDLFSAGHELLEAIKELKPLYRLFPKMDLVHSNHGSMVYRKAKHHGIPRRCLRSYREILEAPQGWKWHDKLLINIPGKQKLYVCHGMSTNGIKFAEQMGTCVVQGHYHSKFQIQYTSSPLKLSWSMQVGCSIDDKSLAMAYNKTTSARPIIGHGIILEGVPKLLHMNLNSKGRWDGIIS